MEPEFTTRTQHLQDVHIADSGLSHIADHTAIADHLNGHNPCQLCSCLVADEEAAKHRRAHISRAIGAR